MSYILYDGPSLLDGQHIFTALTGIENPSRNTKTGPMLHTWHMRSDIHPLEAVQTNADASVCGNCSLRGDHGKGRTCYVNLFRAPSQIFNHKDNFKRELPKALFRNRAVRLGAYGDTASQPTSITAEIVKRAAMTTGYTHQWHNCDPELKKYLMASCDSEEDREVAKALGWATFRIKQPDQPKLKYETTCPASEEGGKVLNCLTCGRCSGGDTKDVVINVHGTGRKHFPIKLLEAA